MKSKQPRPAGARPGDASDSGISSTNVGRPRDSQIDSLVIRAVLDALQKGGYRAVTINAIARRVGRPRSSLYRRWPNKRHLVAYALLKAMGDNPAADTGRVRSDLEAAVRNLLMVFSGPLRSALGGLVADMTHDAALAHTVRQQVLGPRRRSMRAALKRGQARGEVQKRVDIELVLDMLTGPFYYRALFGHAPITRQMTREVLIYVLRVIAPGARRS